ncbi:MAG TPA: hypothetical protein VF800_15185 [Telluria sp.]|jgi:hypothetical protein
MIYIKFRASAVVGCASCSTGHSWECGVASVSNTGFYTHAFTCQCKYAWRGKLSAEVRICQLPGAIGLTGAPEFNVKIDISLLLKHCNKCYNVVFDVIKKQPELLFLRFADARVHCVSAVIKTINPLKFDFAFQRVIPH